MDSGEYACVFSNYKGEVRGKANVEVHGEFVGVKLLCRTHSKRERGHTPAWWSVILSVTNNANIEQFLPNKNSAVEIWSGMYDVTFRQLR